MNVAGILLVFAFLIMPAFTASLLASSFAARLYVGWAFGMLGSLLGLFLAYQVDLPVGATMAVVLCLLSVFGAILGGRRTLALN